MEFLTKENNEDFPKSRFLGNSVRCISLFGKYTFTYSMHSIKAVTLLPFLANTDKQTFPDGLPLTVYKCIMLRFAGGFGPQMQD